MPAARDKRAMYLLTAALASAILLAACGERNKDELHGYLYFAAGSYLAKFDLSDGGSSVVANMGNVSIRHVAPFDRNRILVTIAGTHQGAPYSRVVRLDTQTNATFQLFSATAAWFIPDGEFFLYDDGRALRSRRWQSRSHTDVVLATHRMNLRLPVALLADQELLYEIEIDGEQQIVWFDMRVEHRIPLPELSAICRLDGAVWIASRSLLFCARRGSEVAHPEYLLTSLEADETYSVALPDADFFRAVTYLHDQDVVILSSSDASLISGRPRQGVWAHNVATGQTVQLAEDQHIGESVAWGAR